jgi:hypothetical protein
MMSPALPLHTLIARQTGRLYQTVQLAVVLGRYPHRDL